MILAQTKLRVYMGCNVLKVLYNGLDCRKKYIIIELCFSEFQTQIPETTFRNITELFYIFVEYFASVISSL